LRVEVDLILVIRREVIHQFGDCALCSVLAIHERGNHSNPHVTRLGRFGNYSIFLDRLLLFPIRPPLEYSAQMGEC
jgi:hypothetical protein